jgi:hypothetical protein
VTLFRNRLLHPKTYSIQLRMNRWNTFFSVTHWKSLLARMRQLWSRIHRIWARRIRLHVHQQTKSSNSTQKGARQEDLVSKKTTVLVSSIIISHLFVFCMV